VEKLLATVGRVTTQTTSRTQGRPPVTSHAAIEEAAFSLFEERGFEATTIDDIAAHLGIGRRTLFRYYPSKNDILWGQFDDSLRSFEAHFAAIPADVPLATAIRDALIEFNRLDPSAVPQHRRRMRLLLTAPALLAHSELRYAAWRDVVARFVASRRGEAPSALVPTLAGRVSLAVALTAYERWLASDDVALDELIGEAAESLTLLSG
jgi:TetR/AcrR family transcriptional regulator, regulator of mycofactocin system